MLFIEKLSKKCKTKSSQIFCLESGHGCAKQVTHSFKLIEEKVNIHQFCLRFPSTGHIAFKFSLVSYSQLVIWWPKYKIWHHRKICTQAWHLKKHLHTGFWSTKSLKWHSELFLMTKMFFRCCKHKIRYNFELLVSTTII